MACGIFISSVKFSGQTCQVTFLDASDNLTYQLGDETIPFTYYPPDNSPQGTYFIYFSGTDTTYPLVVSGACPTPTPTLTPTNTPTPTVTTGLTPTATETPTVTPTPTITKTSGIYNALFTSGSTIYNSCYSNNTVRLYFVEPFYTPFQNAYLNSNFTTFAPVGYYTNSGIVYYYNGFDLESQGACPSVTPTSTLTPTPTVTIGLTPTATETLTPTPTVTPTNTVTPSVTPTNTITPTVTPTNTITPTVTASVTPSNTATNTQTPTVTPTKTTTPTKTNTPTPSPTKNYTGCQYYQLSNDSSLGNVIYSYIDCNGGLITGNILPPNPDILLCARKNSIIRTGGVNSLIINDLGMCPTPTPTVTPTQTKTPTPTVTSTNTPTVTITPTNTGTVTQTPTPTNTETPTQTPTPTNTETPTPTNTETPTQTPTLTPTNTETPTNTPTNTETPTQTLTNTPTVTETPTNTPSQTLTTTTTPTPTSTPAVPVTTNIVLYYDPSNPSSYPGSGTTINDISGNGLNGSLSNITFTSPYFTYNGTSSQVSVADNALLEPGSGDWTMEVWVNQTTSGNDVVLGKFDNGGVSLDVSYSIRTTNTTYYAQIGSGSGAGATLFVNSTNYVGTLSTWYQLVYVFKNGGTKTLETFVNGSSIGSVNHSLASILNSTNPLYIGSYNGGEYPQWFDGKIGITRLYNDALTSSEVLQNFNADKSKYGL
jgi:hypothetical protein